MYKDRLLEQYKFPRNACVLREYSHACELLNPSCGDQVAVQICIRNGLIEAVGMQARGCVISVACASLLSEAIKGLSITDVQKIDVSFMEHLSGLALGPVRQGCMMLPVQAVHKALHEI